MIRVPIRDDLRSLDGYHSPQVDVAVRLNTNESPLPPPGAWLDSLRGEIERIAWNRYPDRRATALRSAIASLHGVTADEIFAANGSNEVLQTILLCFAGPGRRVLTFEPTYQLHAHIARLTGATVVEGERRDDFTLDPDEAVRLVDEVRPSVTFLCTPNNPTGLVEPPQTVAVVLDAVTRVGGLLVVDEAYGQFAADSALGSLATDVPLAVVKTFSKTWSMAAARLGYVVAPAWMVAELEKVVLPYHLDAVTQVAGRLAVEYVHEMQERVDIVIAERTRMIASMAAMPVDVVPSGANFILFRPRSVPGAAVWRRLLDGGVLVRDCSSWPRLAGCLRVTVGTAGENDIFLSTLEEALR